MMADRKGTHEALVEAFGADEEATALSIYKEDVESVQI